MRSVRPTFLILLLICSAYAQHTSHQTKADPPKAIEGIIPGMGNLHHPVSTKNPEAQKFFDQGLSFLYAFNHDESIRSFKRAAELDPQLAMAHWGIALALGPNINLDVDPEREQAAYNAVQKALALSANAPANERAYIAALAKRYSNDPKANLKKLAVDYKNAMGQMVQQYPKDLDAATLYAEAAMDLRPWQLWSLDGKPAEGTEEIITVLESVLKRNPNHVGAIHYYIHAVEASPNPERALVYAQRLGNLMPAAGHIVHMPAHIFERTGDFENSARSNEAAAAADRAYMLMRGPEGLYPVMYYSHNLHFLAIAYGMQGRFNDAIKAARALEDNVSPHLKEMPMLEGFMTVTPLLLVKFNRWADIQTLKEPDEAWTASRAIFHFARGVAFAKTGQFADAKREYASLMEANNKVAPDAVIGLNTARQVLDIAERVLEGRIAVALSKPDEAEKIFAGAIAVEDQLRYDEPKPWFAPVRETLGATLLLNHNYAEAEKVFRADLERNKGNGRSLFGLLEALKAQKKTAAMKVVKRQFDAAWKNSDTKLSIGDL
ncbi:MAG: hypothetical protein C5B55_03390 [Blastocatellia bacterium]|nr:MAG: hypothetical protein C5B55_03390 [Blastocatellia bacterium]